jgi:DMSO reductase anchor subunit
MKGQTAVGAIVMWKAAWLSEHMRNSAASRTTYGFVGLMVLGVGLFAATLAFLCWPGEDRIR